MENNEYKLTIEIVGTAKDKKSTTTTPTQNGSTDTKSSVEEQGNTKGVISKVAVYRFAKNLTFKLLGNKVNTIALRTGRQEQQAKMQLLYSAGTRIFNIGESIVMGAFVGGGAPGAIVGAVVGVVNEAIDMGITARNVQYEREIENTQIFLNSIRMGAGANRGNRE